MAWRDHTKPGTTEYVDPIPTGGKITGTDIPGESMASCRIDGDTCRIQYTQDIYQQHRQRDGQTITVDDVPVKLIIEEITP
jgi:hypothetical protein